MSKYKAKYWSGVGKFQELYEEMCDELIPISGSCDTVGGELLRAATRLYYECFNNGFCNNSSGALKYLDAWSREEELLQFDPIAYELADKVIDQEEMYPETTEITEMLLDDLIDLVMEWIVANPSKADAKNEIDMHSLSSDYI